MSQIIPVIDAHCHVFPDVIAEKSKSAVADFYQLPMYTSGTAEHLRQERDKIIEIGGQKFQIVHQLICAPAVTPHQTANINAFITELIRADSALTGFGTLHPENTDYAEILRSFRKNGLCGLKLHSDFQRFPIDDSAMYPVYRTAAELGLPVLFHMGDKKLNFSHPERLKHLMEEIPELTVIAAHMGGYSHWQEAFRLLKPSGRLYFDISSTLQFTDGGLLKAFLNRFGESQFFFGSDFPMWSPEKELEKLLSFGLSGHIMQNLLHDNFVDFIQKQV